MPVLFPIYVKLEDGPPNIISEPAVRAANTLCRQFVFIPKQTILGTERNVGIIVDCCTQMFRFGILARQVEQYVPWQDGAALRQSMYALRWALRSLKFFQDRIPNYGERHSKAPVVIPEERAGYHISAPARHAACTLLKQFEIREKGNIEATERNIAIVIDTHTQIYKVEQVLNETVGKMKYWDVDTQPLVLEEVQESLRVLDLVRQKLPNQGLSVNMKPSERSDIEQKLATSQMEILSELVGDHKFLASVEGQRQMLRQAGQSDT